MKNRIDSPSWIALAEHQQQMQSVHMQDLFLQDPTRFERFSVSQGGLFLDYSKNIITHDTMQRLEALAESSGLQDAIDQLFSGEVVNHTEGRAALHTALRADASTKIMQNGEDIVPPIHASLEAMSRKVNVVRDGFYRGFSGKPMTDVVNIGVGGSDLGPHLACEALQSFASGVRSHFVSQNEQNILQDVLRALDPDTTLVMVVSKSFSTFDTLENAKVFKAWLCDAGGEEAVKQHLWAVTAKAEKAEAFGVLPENILPMWDWVGGRYSLWSAAGVSVALTMGMPAFREMLDGAHDMDHHFKTAPFHQNMPMILAMLGVWYGNFFHCNNRAVISYSQRLQLFPHYLQQLHMESQGKRVRQDGQEIQHQSGPIIWGGVAPNSQHSFHQLFMQGKHRVPIDFILPLKKGANHCYDQQLVAQCLAQSQTLMRGYNEDDIVHHLRACGKTDADIQRLLPHAMIPGNCPSNTLLLETLTPRTFGSLLALYEHKVFAQCVIWGINAFDQWGVERGKALAHEVMCDLQSRSVGKAHDASTQGLMQKIVQTLEPEEVS